MGVQVLDIVYCHVQTRFLEAVRKHGRDPKLISRSMGNRTIGACKKYYSKNRDRLMLDAVAERAKSRRRSRDAAATAAAAAAAATAVVDGPASGSASGTLNPTGYSVGSVGMLLWLWRSGVGRVL